nr:immunoglobulin heavy chain junction region [Homo sapiens]
DRRRHGCVLLCET